MKKTLGFIFLSLIILSGCSNKMKVRQEQREKIAASSGLFCEFVSGDDHLDVDVELNFAMAKRCDAGKNFTVTNYKSSSEINGLVYCCSLKAQPPAPTREAVSKSSPSPTNAPVKSKAIRNSKADDKNTSVDDGDIKAVVPAATSP